MIVSLPDSPCYCSECGAGPSFLVRFENPGVVQQGGIALCPTHAEALAADLTRLVGGVRRSFGDAGGSQVFVPQAHGKLS